MLDPSEVSAWAMVEASPDALVMVDEDGLIELVNRQTEALFGCDRDDLLGRPVESLLPDRFAQVHTAHRTRYRVEPEARTMGSGLDLLARRADGSEVPVEVSLSPMRVGGKLRVIAAVRDISDRVAAEAFEREVRDGLDVVEEGVFMFAADTLVFRYVNQGAVHQTQYSREELLTMTPLHLKPDFTEETFRELLAPALAGEVPSVHFTTVHRRKNGTDIPVEIVLQVPEQQSSTDITSCVALVRDISERLKQEQELAEARQLTSVLEDRERIGRDMHDRVIGRLFAAGMGVQSVIGRVETSSARDRLGDLVEEIDLAIMEIRTTIYGVRSQPDWGKGARGRILAMAADQNDVLGFEPEVRLAGPINALPDTVMEEMLAMIREALTNIAKYAHARTATIDVHVTENSVRVSVADDGVGFSTSGTDADDQLTGHGVANMAARAKTLGGTSTISSSPGQGTTVDWTIPAP